MRAAFLLTMEDTAAFKYVYRTFYDFKLRTSFTYSDGAGGDLDT